MGYHLHCPQESGFTSTLLRSGTHRAATGPNNPPPSYLQATGTGARSFDPSQLEDDEEDENAFVTHAPPDYNLVAGVEAPPPPTPPR